MRNGALFIVLVLEKKKKHFMLISEAIRLAVNFYYSDALKQS